MDKFPELQIQRNTGNEKFHVDGKQLDHDLLSFWQWSGSDLVGNAMRGILAEYIVATALDQAKGHRIEWDSHDIETRNGVKIEVKSGAYIQSWTQKELSAITFNIRPTKAWDSETNTYSPRAERRSDVYVFCLLKHDDKATIDPLNMSQWVFYVIPTTELTRAVGGQKTISLSRLKEIEPTIASYNELQGAISNAANARTT